ncbi:aminoacyl-tRNA hydrolase [Pelovirga terrestris]|uniref:Peptidyl-tRNA hydrolase n=1 Tax=Pelovirga terrestris TaxID=2771352 RepID=A0A8J6QWP5_9BACT|nr:aminoacyl-tRNA hydrolase [Pelovirga terrestris]
MKLLVGLGNYGSEYATTRHNIGFMVAELVAGRFGIALKKKGYQGIYGVGAVASQQTTIILPQTYMNRSGACVHAASSALSVDPADIVVIYDDLDLLFGRIKISKVGGHGGHNGIRDVICALDRRDFVRLRIGIGKPEHGDVTRHVLGPFSSTERVGLPALVAAAADAAELIIAGGVAAAMNKFNGFNLEDNL